MAGRGRIAAFFASLTGRWLGAMLLVHLVLIPVLFGGVLLIARRAYEDQFVDYARADAYSFVRLAGADARPARLRALAQDALDSGRVVYVAIELPRRPTVVRHRGRATDPAGEDFFFGQRGDDTYYIKLPFVTGQRQAPGLITLGYDETGTREAMAAMYWRGLGLALAYVLLTGALIVVLAPTILRPLRQLRERSRQIARGQFNEQLNVTTDLAELRGLADDLDFMRAELVKQAATLEFQALHDGLTGLPNRALLQDRLRQITAMAQRGQQRVGLLLLDLDHFKEINDTLGHAAGDRMLQKVATRLRDVARESDTVARLGGDEFALLLLTRDIAAIETIARKIVQAMDRPFDFDQERLHIGGSVGIAYYPDHGDTFDVLLRKADIAMYESKRQRRGYTIYSTDLDRHSLGELTLAAELRHAVDHGELVLHYQPKIDLRRRVLSGVEALVRWRHPRQGLLKPDRFIALAERSGLIGLLTRWVINEALRQTQVWHARGMGVIPVAVNISARCLQDERFSNYVEQAVRVNGASAKQLQLELTESVIMADPLRAQDLLSRLHANGIHLSIDDFGTGYSSLAHLKRLPVSEVKIDKSFIIDMRTDENDAVIAQTIIALAGALRIDVVAEGVEDQATLQLLEKAGCDLAQGNYISPPLDAGSFEHWYRHSYGGQQRQLTAGSGP